MDSAELEVLAPKLVEEIKIASRQNGNSFVEATKVMKVLFPQGIAGKEQDAFAMVRILDKMFRIANAPSETASILWQELCAYALSGLKATPI
jgi:hypothetical protein